MRTRLLQCRLESPLGGLELWSTETGLCALLFEDHRTTIESRLIRRFGDNIPETGDPFGACEALDAWFRGSSQALDLLPLDPGGTPFQKEVWSTLRKIPLGKTFSYGQVAEAIGRPSAARAVGSANGANPLPIIVPCHRVVGTRGALTGFAFGIERKKWLLDYERSGA